MKKDFVKFIPDPKEGLVNRPDGRYSKNEKGEPMSMADLLTDGKTEFSRLAGESQIYMYAPSVRRKISERVVDGRVQMGGIVSMTQTMKSAHDLISTTKDGADTFTFMDWNNMNKVKKDRQKILY